jgi:hypothetical protein
LEFVAPLQISYKNAYRVSSENPVPNGVVLCFDNRTA